LGLDWLRWIGRAMSEKYMSIGAPMTELPVAQPRGYTSHSHRATSAMAGGAKFHDSCHSGSGSGYGTMNGAMSSRDQPLQKGESPLRICSLSKEEFTISKDAKFSPGIQVSCPYLYCSSKNSQFQNAGRFPSEFVLNHLHSSHKHRRFNGDTLDMTMVVPSVDVDHMSSLGNMKKAGSTSNLSEKNLPPGPSTTQTWPFVEVYCNKRYFYLEAQSYIIDGHPELFLWLWFLGSDHEEMHYKYHLTVIHGKSEYSYKGPVISLMRSSNEVRNEGRCLVIREKVWDYMSYKLRIHKV